MQRELYERVWEVVVEIDPYLKIKPDATGKPSATADQKLFGALCQLNLCIGSDSDSE